MKDATSLTEVRDNIDRLDREIIELIAERSRFVESAARFKTSHADVEAPERVEQVIAKVRSFSESRGLSPDIAERIYRAMINSFIGLEKSIFNSLRSSD